jgi:hypothetical protein
VVSLTRLHGVIRKQTVTLIVSRPALFRVITRPSGGNFIPTFRDDLWILSSRDGLSGYVGKKLSLFGRVMTQKSAVLIYFTSEN